MLHAVIITTDTMGNWHELQLNHNIVDDLKETALRPALMKVESLIKFWILTVTQVLRLFSQEFGYYFAKTNDPVSPAAACEMKAWTCSKKEKSKDIFLI